MRDLQRGGFDDKMTRRKNIDIVIDKPAVRELIDTYMHGRRVQNG